MKQYRSKGELMDPRFISRTVAANNQRIHLVEAGEGPLVLFVHGFPELWYSWRHQLSALADAGYRAVAGDPPGADRSSKPPHIHDYRITELVADLVGVVEALGETTATVVGHDWGAPVAWTAAWTRPEVFTSVVGLSPWGGRGLMALPSSPFGERPQSEVERWIAGPDLLPRVLRRTRADGGRVRRRREGLDRGRALLNVSPAARAPPASQRR